MQNNNDNDKKEGFKIIDKRGRREEEEKEEVEEKEEELIEDKEVKLEEVADVYTLIKFFISLLTGQAWLNMGLIAHPQTHQQVRDLNQAKLAIDCISWLFEKIEEKLTELEKREIRTLISDLKINYVNQSKLLG